MIPKEQLINFLGVILIPMQTLQVGNLDDVGVMGYLEQGGLGSLSVLIPYAMCTV